ncbi:MAG: hypothetical protein AMXMBFR23_25460 [Chloroflexota bacterium]
MDNRRRARWGRWLLIAAAAACALVAGPVTAQVTPPDEAPKDAPRRITTLEDLGFADRAAFGASAQLDFFFSGSGDYELSDGSRLVVELTHSNLLSPDQSAVAVSLNDRPLQAIRLDETNIRGGTYEIPVPQDLIFPAFNKLSFTFNMTTGLFCEAPANSALFATILSSSFFEIDFAQDPPVPALEAPNLADYPYPFFEPGYPIVAPVVIAIPANPTSAEMTAAYRLATDLTTRVSFDLELLNVRTVTTLAPADLAKSQLIVIGSARRNPILREALANTTARQSQDGTLTVAGRDLDEAAGYIALVESPWNRLLRTLIVTGDTDDAIGRAVDALTLAETAALLAGPEAVLTEPILPPDQVAFQSVFTFRDAGTGESTFRGGAGTTSVVFSSPAPAPGSTGTLELVISVPEDLDRRRSNIIVDLNGQTIATVRLDDEQLRRATYRVEIPGDVIRVGPNTLQMQANLYDSQSLVLAPCESYAPERLWITIHDDSAVSLPSSAGITSGADLAGLPFPFAGLRGVRETTFVIDATRPESFRAGMLAVIALGRRFGAVNEYNVLPALTATPEIIGDRHVVAVGVPPDTDFGQVLSDALPLVFRPDGTRAIIEDSGTLAEILDTSRVGAVQMVQVPWAPTRSLLSVNGTDDTALRWASEALVTRSLDGNVALLQSARQISTFSLTRARVEDVQRALEDRFTEREARLRTIVAFSMIGVGAVLLAVLWGLRGRLVPRIGGAGRRR